MDSRKEQILEASKNLFNRLGYSKTSVDDIAKTLGMTKSSLYYYFKNKEELFFKAFSSEWEENLETFEQKARQQENPFDQIMSYTRETLRYHEQTVLQHKIPVSTVVETRNLFREFVSKVNERRLKFYVENIERGIKEGIFEECDAVRIAKTFVGVKFAIQYDSYLKFLNQSPTKEDFDKIEGNVMFALELMLKGIMKK